MGAFGRELQAAFGGTRHDVSTWGIKKSPKEVYWEWYWGINPENTAIHSPKKKFTDFQELKEYSAIHSQEHSWINGYWSSYDKITVE